MAFTHIFLLASLCIGSFAIDYTDEEIKARAIELYEAGTCDAIETSDVCGDDTESYFLDIEYSDDIRIIVSSGVPDHTAEDGSSRITRCERWQYVVLGNYPGKGSRFRSMGMGSIGWATSGGTFFDPRSQSTGELAWFYEIDSMDSCDGHSNPDKQYHYHFNPSCIDGATNATACQFLGYWYDGNPIHGLCAGSDGTAMKSCYVLNDGEDGDHWDDYTWTDSDDCELDEANGFTDSDGVYKYVVTEDYPYVPVGYYFRRANAQAQAQDCNFSMS